MSDSEQVIRQRTKAGDWISSLTLVSIRSEQVAIPDSGRIVHLQFRRFAGCPVCNLHLRSIVRRHDELQAAGIREVVVFHSTAERLRVHAGDLPFAVIADPGKELYRAFRVEQSVVSLLHPRAWMPIVRGILSALWERRPAPELRPEGGRFGLPADFLISPNGIVLAAKYGTHVSDQWEVDDILRLVVANRERDARC